MSRMGTTTERVVTGRLAMHYQPSPNSESGSKAWWREKKRPVVNNGQVGATYEKYRSELQNLLDRPEAENRSGAETWKRVHQWYQDDGGRELFLSAFENVTGIRPNVETSTDQRIGAALPKSFRDYERKLKDKAYYRALAEMFIEEIDRVVIRVPRESEDPATTFLYGNLIRFIKHIFLDSRYLFQEWGTYISEPPISFGIGKNLLTHPVGFFHGAFQIIYGHGTFGLSFADNHSELAMATIRQAVEIRIRRAFGVVGRERVNDGTIQPVALSTIIDVMAEHADQVDLAVPIEHVRRVNHWANLHMHSGMRHYSWVPPRVLSYLRPLLVGREESNGGWSVDNGIRLSRGTFEAIRETLRNKMEASESEHVESSFRAVLWKNSIVQWY